MPTHLIPRDELTGYFRFYKFAQAPTKGPGGETVFYLEARKVESRLVLCPNRIMAWVEFDGQGGVVGNIRLFVADEQNRPVLEVSSTDPHKNWRKHLEERLAILHRVLLRWRTCPSCGGNMAVAALPERPDHAYYRCVLSDRHGNIGLGDGLRRALLNQRAAMPPEAPAAGKVQELELAGTLF